MIKAEVFGTGFLEGDSNYHSITAASDGKIYFTVNSHHPFQAARVYRFDPASESVEEIGNINEILGEDVNRQIAHGKVHTPLEEYAGYLYFATHTSNYVGTLPNMEPDDGRLPYEGGHFMRYNLETGTFEDLAHLSLANEGIITMAVDKVNGTLYGLTWPTSLLISYDLDSGLLHNWGAVQDRGEWGRLPEEWEFICRRLGVDDEGTVYGSTHTGRIWRFERGEQRPVNYYENLDLDFVPPIQSEGFTIPAEPHYFWRNWRTILWNPNTDSFWGLHGGSTQLFEFSPGTGILHSVRNLRAEGIEESRRNPYRTQLGFTLGPENTLFYLAHGPALELEGRKNVNSSVHLITYGIDSGEFRDHGMLMGPEERRIFFTESLIIGPDDHLYTVAWVETIDPERMEKIQAARGKAQPAETQEAIYEIQLVRLPRWQQFLD